MTQESNSARLLLIENKVGLQLALFSLIANPSRVLAANIKEDDLKVHLVDNGLNLFQLLGRVIDLVLLLAGIVAFFYVLYGGFTYLTAGGDSGAVTKARTTILNALIGIVIIAFSYAITRFIVQATQGNFSGI